MNNPIGIAKRQYAATTIEGEIATSGVYDSEDDALRDLIGNGVDASCAVSVIEMCVSYGRVQSVDVWQYGSIEQFFERANEAGDA